MLNILNQIIPDNPWKPGDEIAFSIGDFHVAWYGIFIFIGFSFAIIAALLKTWKWYKISTDVIYWYCIMLIPTAIIGARFWSYCIGDAVDWSKFFMFQTGGLAIEGGVTLSVILALWWFPFFSKNPKYHVRDEFGPMPAVRQVSMWVYADACLPAIFIGQIIGRWGNYFNQELYGPIVQSEWLQNALNHTIPFMYVGSEWHHPLFLYEGFFNFIGFITIYIGLEFVKTRKAGDLGILYFLWYGVVRLSLEPLRHPEYTFMLSYVLSGIWVATGVILLVLNHTVFWRIRKYRASKISFAYISCLFKVLWSKICLVFTRVDSNRVNQITKQQTEKENFKLKFKKYTKSESEMFHYRGL